MRVLGLKTDAYNKTYLHYTVMNINLEFQRPGLTHVLLDSVTEGVRLDKMI